MSNFLQDGDGNKSSKRLAAFIFPSLLDAGGLVAIILGVITNAGQWPILGGTGAIVVGCVLQLVLFGYINVESIAKIAADKLKPPQ